jgi:hypothetical protein
MKLTGRAKLVRIHLGERDQWDGRPLYQAIIEEARRQALTGATAYHGVAGYLSSTPVHRARLFTASDLPVIVSLIDEEWKIKRFLPVLDVMVKEGLIEITDIDVIRYVHGDEVADEPMSL